MMDKEDSKLFEHYKKQKQKAERNGNLKNQAEACSVIGEIYARYERYDEAIQEHQQELLLNEAENCMLSIALANRKLGECYCKKQLFDKAIPLHKRYLGLAKDCNEKVEVQRALATLGATYLAQCECENTFKRKREAYRLAEECFMKGLQATEEIQSSLKEVDYMDMKGRLYQNLGLLYDEMNKGESSSQYFQKALAINKKYNLLENLFLCQSSLVSVYQKHGNMVEAKKHMESCLETAKKMKSKDNEAVALMLNAMILLQEKEFPMSRHLFKKAHKVGLPSQKEKYEKCYRCVKILHKGTETLTDIPDEMLNKRIQQYDRMGDAAAELGLYKQAIHFYEKLLQASKDMQKSKKEMAPVHVSLAETFRDDKQLEKAVKHYRQEITCYSDQEQDQVCRSWLNIGSIQELLSDNYAQPQESYVNAFNAAKHAKNRKLQVVALENLISLFKFHKKEKLLAKTKEKLDHTVSKYQISDSELEEDSQDVDEVELDKEDDVSDMSELTESEDEEIPANTVSMTTVRSGGTTKRKVIKRNLKGETPLHTACIDGKLSEVVKMINQGHPVNVRDNGGWTPLHEASNFGHNEIVKVLIEHGADVNDRGGSECSGLTPLMDAASNGMLDCVRLLINAGATVHSKDDNMLTALDHLRDYVERVKDEITDKEMLEYKHMVEKLKDKMPFYRAPTKVNLSQKSALIPESEASSFTKSVGTGNRKRSRNDIIYDDSDSDHETSHNYKRTTTRRSPSPAYNSDSRMSDDLLYSSHLKDLDLEDNATVAYRKAMAGIGSSAQRSSQTTKKSPNQSSKKTALVSETEYIQDDWLIDDMKPVAKRRKVGVDGYSLTSGLIPREQTDSRGRSHRMEKNHKNSCPRRRTVISDSDIESETESPAIVEEIDYSLVISHSDDDTETITPMRDSPVLSVMVDLPVISYNRGEQNTVESNKEIESIDLTKNGLKKREFKKTTISRQTRLTDFGASVSKCVISSQSDRENNSCVVSRTQNQALHEEEKTVTSFGDQLAAKVLKITVQIQDKLLFVPIIDRCGTRTISWLAEECSSRYFKMFGLKPILTLGTKDGAHFSSDDLTSLILTDGDKIEGFLQGWHLPPMTEQYKSACKSLNTVMYKNIENLLQSCQTGTGVLKLGNLSLRSVRFQPVLKAIQHQNCLRELELKGNQLGDSGMESLSTIFSTLPNLIYLGLSCNNITKKGLLHISDAVMKDKDNTLKNLTNLDISYNPLFDDCQQQLISLIKSVPTLNKLFIASCNLTAVFFKTERPMIAQVLNDSNLQHVDLSFNLLESSGAYLFLRCLNPTKILSLNLSSTASKRSTRICEYLDDYLSQDGCVLQKLKLCNLKICTEASDLLMRLIQTASHLQSIDLSSNLALTNEVMTNVIRGSCHDQSHLEQLILNNCGLTSPFSLELLDTIAEQLTMSCPLRDLQFTCPGLNKADVESVKHIWREKWSDDAVINITDKSVKLGVIS